MNTDKLEQYLDELSDGTDFHLEYQKQQMKRLSCICKAIILVVKIGVLNLQ